MSSFRPRDIYVPIKDIDEVLPYLTVRRGSNLHSGKWHYINCRSTNVNVMFSCVVGGRVTEQSDSVAVIPVKFEEDDPRCDAFNAIDNMILSLLHKEYGPKLTMTPTMSTDVSFLTYKPKQVMWIKMKTGSSGGTTFVTKTMSSTLGEITRVGDYTGVGAGARVHITLYLRGVYVNRGSAKVSWHADKVIIYAPCESPKKTAMELPSELMKFASMKEEDDVYMDTPETKKESKPALTREKCVVGEPPKKKAKSSRHRISSSTVLPSFFNEPEVYDGASSDMSDGLMVE